MGQIIFISLVVISLLGAGIGIWYFTGGNTPSLSGGKFEIDSYIKAAELDLANMPEGSKELYKHIAPLLNDVKAGINAISKPDVSQHVVSLISSVQKGTTDAEKDLKEKLSKAWTSLKALPQQLDDLTKKQDELPENEKKKIKFDAKTLSDYLKEKSEELKEALGTSESQPESNAAVSTDEGGADNTDSSMVHAAVRDHVQNQKE